MTGNMGRGSDLSPSNAWGLGLLKRMGCGIGPAGNHLFIERLGLGSRPLSPLPREIEQPDDRERGSHSPQQPVNAPGEDHDRDGDRYGNRQQAEGDYPPLTLLLGEVAPAASAGAGLLLA